MTKSNSLNFALSALLAGILIPLPGVRGQQAPASSNAKGYVNSIGLKMVRIAPGRFRMGNDAATDPKRFGQSWLLPNGDYDERPTHEVVISQGFHISETEVTLEQFQKYRFDAQDDGRFSPFVSNVTWSEAQAFCDWLSKREAKHYRLPTEAEWEYVARGGGAGPFPGGDIPPLSGAANAFGVKNMNTDVLEWVADWYGPYSWREETDPVGPKDGVARVVRGGGIMGPFHGGPAATVPYYRRSQNRGSVAPEYRSGAIGFRIVEGPALNQPARDAEPVFAEQFVKTAKDMGAVPFRPVTSPWFHVRAILPSPPENMWPDAIAASGMNPGFLGHIHSTGAAACSNGDVLWIGFASSTPDTEYLPNTNMDGQPPSQRERPVGHALHVLTILRMSTISRRCSGARAPLCGFLAAAWACAMCHFANGSRTIVAQPGVVSVSLWFRGIPADTILSRSTAPSAARMARSLSPVTPSAPNPCSG